MAREFDLPELAVEDAVKAHQRRSWRWGRPLLRRVKTVRYVDSDEVVDIAEIAVFVGPRFMSPYGTASPCSCSGEARAGHGRSDLAELGSTGVLHRTVDLGGRRVRGGRGRDTQDVDEIRRRSLAARSGSHGTDLQAQTEVAEFQRAPLPLDGHARRSQMAMLPVHRRPADRTSGTCTTTSFGPEPPSRPSTVSSLTFFRRTSPASVSARMRSPFARTRTCARSPPGRQYPGGAHHGRRDLRHELRQHAGARWRYGYLAVWLILAVAASSTTAQRAGWFDRRPGLASFGPDTRNVVSPPHRATRCGRPRFASRSSIARPPSSGALANVTFEEAGPAS